MPIGLSITTEQSAQVSPTAKQRLRAHVAIMRLDHSVKQLFILPGIILALTIGHVHPDRKLATRCILAIFAAVLVASSNYVLNEILDAPFDRAHPTKRNRAAAHGLIRARDSYVQWLVLGLCGALVGAVVSRYLLICLVALWIMGFLYNVPPFRSKDLPYLDVLSESLNNPIRFCIGWYATLSFLLPPTSMLIAYWLIGGYFMALKRFSEYRQIGRQTACAYRKSFLYYSEQSLLNSVCFYAAGSMLFFGAFSMRYRFDMVLTFPLVAWLMMVYFSMAFEADSPVQHPEKLWRQSRLMIPLTVCSLSIFLLLHNAFSWLKILFPESIAR